MQAGVGGGGGEDRHGGGGGGGEGVVGRVESTTLKRWHIRHLLDKETL